MARPTRLRWGGARLLLASLVAVALVAPVVDPTLALDPAVPPVTSTTRPPACGLADVLARNRQPSMWAVTLLDWTYRLPSGYRPPNLVPVLRAGLSGGGSVRRELIPDLRAMAAAARAAGAPLAVESAYRSYRSQVSTFAYWRMRFGYQTALIGSARPGHSEHQLGTTIDFKASGGAQPWSIRGFDFGTTRAGRWLARNAWKYGFVMSYPYGERAKACYGYEPWHYRYYGRTIAAAIHRSGLVPRVWLWRHGNDPAGPGPTPTPTPVPTPTVGPTPAPTDAPGPTPTDQPSPSPEPTAPPAATASPTPAATAEPSPTPEPTEPPAATGSPAPTATAEPAETPAG